MYWDDEDSQGMSDIQKEYIAALLDGIMPDLMNEIWETAQKFDNDIRKSSGLKSRYPQECEKKRDPVVADEKKRDPVVADDKNDEITKEQNKNFTKIPRVLMIRANSLNHWFYWLIGIAANVWLTKTIETVRVPYDPNDPVRLIVPLSWAIITFWGSANLGISCEKTLEADKIRKKMLRYQKGTDDYLDFDFGHFGINRGVIIRYLSKKNPAIFNKLMTNRRSVKDDKVAENIILGHLRNCPGDAQRVLDVFGKSLSNKVLRRVQRYNNIQK